MKNIKYNSLNKKLKNYNTNTSNIINLSPTHNKSLRNNNNKNKIQKKEILKIIQKRINNEKLKNNNINYYRPNNIEKIKNNKTNITASSKSINKRFKNRKVDFKGISLIKDKVNNKNKSQNSYDKYLKKEQSNRNIFNLKEFNLTNYKRFIIHRQTKSSFFQDPQVLTHIFKDMNNTEIENKLNKNNNEQKENHKNTNVNNINNYSNYNSKLNFFKNKNTNKINRNCLFKKEIQKNLVIKNNRENKDKEGLIKLKEELKINNNQNCGLTKKFVDAQNNWRKNYFATVIQKIYRGYVFRKSDYKKRIKNINNIYIRKRAKDVNPRNGTTVNHRKCPTEENLNIICINLGRNNKRKGMAKPPKIKEIFITRNAKRYNPYNYSTFYFNNYIYNCNDSYYYQTNNQNIFFKYKYIFDKWKEITNKKKILYNLKIMKKYQKKNYRYYSYEKKKDRNYNNIFNKNFFTPFKI